MASSKKQAHKQRQHGSGSGPGGRPRGISDIAGPPPPGRPRTAEGTGGAPVGGNSIPATPTGRQKRLHTADGTRPREPLVRNTPVESPPLSNQTSKAPIPQGTNGTGPLFGPAPKYSPPPEPPRTSDPFDRRQGYRGLVDAVGEGLYLDDGDQYSESRRPPAAAARTAATPVSRSDELLLNSRNSHAALRGLYSRHRPALDEHGNPMGVDLEQRKAQIVRRWSQRVTMIDSDDLQRQEHQRPEVSSGPTQSQLRHDEPAVSPPRPQDSPITSPVFTGGASLATVSSASTSSTRPGSASSGGSGSVRTPTDHTYPMLPRSGGHQQQGSEATVRPATQEKARRVMVGMSPYGVPIYREVRQDESDLEPHLAGTNQVGKNKDKDKVATNGKSEGGGGLGWLLSPQAKAEKAAAKVQAKMEKRAREAAEREAALIREAERRKLKEEVQDRLAKVRAGSMKDPQVKELARIDGYQFAFMGNM